MSVSQAGRPGGDVALVPVWWPPPTHAEQAAAHTLETPHIAKHIHIRDITHTITVKYNKSHNNYK